MPGVRWFPGGALNYAEQALVPRHADARRASPWSPRSQTRDPIELTWAELADAGGPLRGRAAPPRRRPSATGSSPTPRTSPRRSSRSSPRRRSARRGRAARPSSACGRSSTASPRSSPAVLVAVDGYRYGAKDDRPARPGRRDRRRPADAAPRRPRPVPRPSATATGCRRRGRAAAPDGPHDVVGRAARHARRAVVHAGCRRPPAVRAVQLGHHRAAQGDRPRPRRASSPSTSRSLTLHQDLGPADRFFWFTTTGWMMWNYLVSGLLAGVDRRAVRRRPGGSVDSTRSGTSSPSTGVTVFGASAPFLMACRKAGLAPRRGGAALGRLDRGAAAGRRVPLGRRHRRRAGRLDQRRHRRVHGVRRRRPPCSRCAPARSAAGCSGARSRRSPPTARPCPPGVTGELVITAPMPSMPVGLLGRRRRLAVPRRLLRRLPRRVAPRRLGHVHRRRRVRGHRPLRRHAEPGRRAPRHERLLRRRRGLRRGRRQPRRAPRGRRATRAASASCCCSSCSSRGRARRRPARRDPPGARAASCRRATCPT